ncbi:MAG: DedA family protein [Candidatus Schekmanbacteria bacterium]|nr:DedA family protein [Candidatus Schekmanbacteria bacterium]
MLQLFLDYFLHIDKHLDQLVASAGGWSYVVLFVVIFCETGLVVTPILPGDSLLFAAGAIAARGDSINIHLLAIALMAAAILGDGVNYYVGSRLGLKVFDNPKSRIFKRNYLERTQRFYERYGGKTIILARFVPIVRTFAPFLAGVGTMTYARFAMYNVAGAVLWVAIVLYSGYFFGGIPIIKNNFTLVVLGIIFVSILPALVGATRGFLESRRTSAAA